MNSQTILQKLVAMGDPQRAIHSQRYFKTGEGQYGYGDVFLGIKVPEVRQLAAKYRGIWTVTGDLPDGTGAANPFETVVQLLYSEYHEARLLAVFLMVEGFRRGDEPLKERIFNLYIENTTQINNWDLVDSSAHKIVGPWLEHRDRSLLYRFAESPLLWERRIAVISTLHFINRDDFTNILALAEILLDDREDLMHKAVGWMLREVGKRDIAPLEDFLQKHVLRMPRTMLRYAIERLPEPRRKAWLGK